MKKLLFFLIFIPCLLMVTGCWNRRELNELALVVAMSIDKCEEGYVITAQVVEPNEVASQKGGSGRSPVTTYTEKGKYIFEAIRRMTTVSPRKLYFSHLQMLVVGEEIAREGISKPLELLTRDPEFRKDFYIAVAKGVKGNEILENLTSIEKIPANKLHSSLETSEKAWAPTIAVQMDELVNDLTSEGKNAVLTGITIRGNVNKAASMENVTRIEPYARLKYKDIAVFKKDKLIGWLNEKESKGYNYITDNVTNTVGDVPCLEDEKLVVEIIRSKSKISGKVINGKPKINVDIFAEANVGEVACNIDLTKPETIRKLEKSVNQVNVNILQTSIKKAQKLGVDIYGFGEVIHRADPKAWRTLKKDWNSHFIELDVNIHSNIKIRRTGVSNESFINKIRGE
ncbi:Ger(x)C family spore germination protein [Bacillus sp. DNRA2]|uniref:Ger(x)C family spore germination protein n=1 Tax=Bacillus sp. DNRA2 TaxID=2723053 RepID=UPI00145DF37C|nr:Ger(x)C family spore germination protein [Bacillus sp. DNRA2]NMD69162.1 Ger(x)C family spore germination protein [Bacillus sp. DNRA2]